MALVLPSLLLALAAQGDPAKDLRSKDFAVRLQAIEILAASGEDKEASKLLVASLKDDDWEVVEAAIDALGKVAGKGADKKLLDLALDAPLMRHRRAAARALATGYGAEAWIQLEKKMSSKTAVPAAQAAAAFGALAGQVDLDKL